MVERVSISPTNITLKDGSSNVIFSTDNDYVKTYSSSGYSVGGMYPSHTASGHNVISLQGSRARAGYYPNKSYTWNGSAAPSNYTISLTGIPTYFDVLSFAEIFHDTAGTAGETYTTLGSVKNITRSSGTVIGTMIWVKQRAEIINSSYPYVDSYYPRVLSLNGTPHLGTVKLPFSKMGYTIGLYKVYINVDIMLNKNPTSRFLRVT